ncbi:LysR substrate-binding domain-containing protein [Aurantiacibacter poecillastricola]|uniref:LysR substrate-binding domain-containing protein n=1 Tax=Aurantiacibacter poecillastricola TaxID=3064385 RepID=UPI0027400B09|nr:LysR substrate-binding domain-containing protein [Aurantiacibacter sp. 219JJ12-13]MDP5261269.1 LysR substrate-binding domain-containing protein [Aurantiacibacter sp. 219JJ12-13]
MEKRWFNIRHFGALAATMEHGTVSAAARAINLTQPALTQAIARLESELECTLFERGPLGMTPTEPSLLLAPRAKRAIAHIGSTRVTGTQMRAFLAVARAGSYSEASAITGLSTASLHRAIADLSVALGQRLIDRRGRSIALTTQGQKRARGFGLALAELRAGLDEVADWQGKAAGRIVIGAMPLSRARWLPVALAKFIREWPQVDIAVTEGSYAELSGPLRDGEVDLMLGALREADPPDDLEQRPTFIDQPMLIMRSGHPLIAKGGTFETARLGEYPWILPGSDTPLRHYWEDMMRHCKLEPPHVRVECGSVLTIRELLLLGEGITLLSPDQLRVELESGVLASVPCPVEVKRTIGIITRKDWRPTRSQAFLLALLEQRLESN